MKNLFNKSMLLGIIIGGLIFGTLGVSAAYLFDAEQVSYNGKNVKSALEELYSVMGTAIGNIELIDGIDSTGTITYTADGKYKYFICDAGQAGTITTDGTKMFVSDSYSIGGAHTHKIAVIKLEVGQYVTISGWTAYLYGSGVSINNIELIDGINSTGTITYTADGKYKYFVCDAGQTGTITTDGTKMFVSDSYSIGGAHTHRLAVIKLEKGQSITVSGWTAYLYGIN